MPVRPGISKEDVEAVRRRLDRVYLKTVLKSFHLRETVTIAPGQKYRQLILTLKILNQNERDEASRHLSRRKILLEIERHFVRRLAQGLRKRHDEMINQREEMLHRRAKYGREGSDETPEEGNRKKVQDEEQSSDEEEGGADADAADAKLKQRHDDAAEYEGEEEEAVEVAPNVPQEDLYTESEEEEDGDKDESGPKESTMDFDADREVVEERKSTEKAMDPNRVKTVLDCKPLVVDYRYDAKNDKWCTVTFQVRLVDDIESFHNYNHSK